MQTRQVDGRSLDYVEGWFAVAEANAIFGFGGWDRETIHFERIFERTRGDTTQCSYLARVRIRVRAGKELVSRDGTGWGAASSRNPAEAHELAAKAAETDATKRALATFGNRFGLSLYDKDQAGVTPRETRPTFVIHDEDGVLFASALSPEGFAAGMRQMIEKVDAGHLDSLWQHNVLESERLKRAVPDLKSKAGVHYADLLERLFRARSGVTVSSEVCPPCEPRVTAEDTRVPDVPSQRSVSEVLANVSEAKSLPVPTYPLAASRIALGPRIDKASLALATTRRMRDKNHLRQVGTLPCLVCKSAPSHAHHLTFAQARGLSLKVSDEFCIPLCPSHHSELHASGAEELWWNRVGIDPLPIARQLWDQRAHTEARSEVA